MKDEKKYFIYKRWMIYVLIKKNKMNKVEVRKDLIS